MRMPQPRKLAVWIGALAALSSGACTGGINAGEEGGLAFIAFTVMLLITIAVLWFFLGRED
jgi:hypothetical protein